MNRPEVHITTRLPMVLAVAVDRLAFKQHRSRSELVRIALTKYLQSQMTKELTHD